MRIPTLRSSHSGTLRENPDPALLALLGTLRENPNFALLTLLGTLRENPDPALLALLGTLRENPNSALLAFGIRSRTATPVTDSIVGRQPRSSGSQASSLSLRQQAISTSSIKIDGPSARLAFGAEVGIRTRGGFHHTRFPSEHIRPL